MAHECVLADRMFHRSSTRVSSPISTSSRRKRTSSVDVPVCYWGCPGGPDDTVATITQERTYGTGRRPASTIKPSATSSTAPACRGASTRARYEADQRALVGYQAVKHIHDGPDWKKDVITPQKRFLTDVPPASSRTSRGSRRSATIPITSNCGGGYGPSWVASLVNAVGESKFWNSTGRSSCNGTIGAASYDHVPPPYKDYDGLGFRVPLLVISPVREEELRLARAVRDGKRAALRRRSLRPRHTRRGRRRATSPAGDCFDFSQKPRKFVPIKAPQEPLSSSCPAPPTIAPEFPTTVNAFAALAVALPRSLAGCSLGAQSSLPYMHERDRAARRSTRPAPARFKHVILHRPGERSFDNLFPGYPGADTVSSGKNSERQNVTLQPVEPGRRNTTSITRRKAMFAACNGTGKLPGTECRMNGFDSEGRFGGPASSIPVRLRAAHESKPYFDMAHEWVLADRMFRRSSTRASSRISTSSRRRRTRAVDLPATTWGCGGGGASIGPDDHDAAHAGPAADALLRLPDARRRARRRAAARGASTRASTQHVERRRRRAGPAIRPSSTSTTGPIGRRRHHAAERKFLTDVAAGKLANFTWITPVCNDSDHVNCGGGLRPVVGRGARQRGRQEQVLEHDGDLRAVGRLGRPLRSRCRRRTKTTTASGFRVPLLVISPYAKQNYVSHVQYETASVLRFAEDSSASGSSPRPTRARTRPAGDCFDFSQPPRAFVPINAPLASEILHAQPGRRLLRSRLRIEHSVLWRSRPLAPARDARVRVATALPYMQRRYRVAGARRNRRRQDRTSSTSCRRTAASTTSSKAIRAPTPFRAAKIPRANDRAEAGQPRRRIRDRSFGQAMFAACDGTGKLPARTAEWTASTASLVRRSAQPAVRLRAAQRVEAILRHGARMGARRPDVPVAARRELRRAPVRHRRAGACDASIFRTADWGCDGGRPTLVPTITEDRNTAGPTSRPCFDYQTLGDELDKAQADVALLRQRYGSGSSDRGATWSGYQAVKHISLRARLEETSSRRTGSSSPTFARASSRTSPGSRRSATIPITRTAAAATGRRGSRRSSTRSARASSGIRRRSSSSGTIGAACTITCRRRTRTTTASASAFRCW